MRSVRVLPTGVAVGAAAIGGAILSAAFPAPGWWILAIPATALILWSLIGRGIATGLLVGFVAGFAFYGIHIFWLTTYLGAVPWLALAGLESLLFAVGGAAIALAWRFGDRAIHSAPGRLLILPVIVAGLWVAREAVASVWPYGGFSWGRLAFSQSESPLGDLVAWVGASGLSFVLALIAAMAVQAVRELRVSPWRRFVAVGAVAVVALVMPAWPVPDEGTIRIAAVQGDSAAGLFSQRERGDILNDHLQATVPVLDEDVDLLVWPENAADVNPLVHRDAAQVLDFVTEQMDVPLVVGTITTDERDRTFNSLLLWEQGEGSVDQYDKIHPVPFAEYLPDREFWYPLAPDLFDLVPRDFSFGERPNVFDIDGVSAGLAICFDIVDDALLRQMMDGGAQVILAPTNNADFGQSQESVQQLGIARIRAMEFGRSVVNTSTVGTSAIVAPDGSTMAQLPTFEPGAMVEDVPLSTTVTPASVIGPGVEWLAGFGGLAGLLATALMVRRRSASDGSGAASRD